MSSSRVEEKSDIQTIIDTYSMQRTIDKICLNNVPDEVYLIPDVHGRNDLLQAALAKVSDGSAVIMLGDFGDRGIDSLGVYESMFAFNQRRSAKKICPIVAIPGNHEENFLDLFRDRKIAEAVVGKECLQRIENDYDSDPTLSPDKWHEKLKEMGLEKNAILPVLDYIASRQFMEQDAIGGRWAVDLICKRGGGEDIAKYIASLPIILECTIPLPFSDNPEKTFTETFAAVHAVLPVKFEELSNTTELTQSQQSDALNIRLIGSNPDSLPMKPELPVVFCGHSIVDNAEDAVIGQHVDLDMGACREACGVLFMYAVKANKIHLYVDEKVQRETPVVIEKFTTIAKHIEATMVTRRNQLQKLARENEEKISAKENESPHIIPPAENKPLENKSPLLKHTILTQITNSNLKRQLPEDKVPLGDKQNDEERASSIKIKLMNL